MQATFLKRFDALAGPLLVRFLPKRGPVTAAPPQSILVIRPGGIGDAVLLVPALRALLEAHPGCRVEILAEKRNAAVFSFCPGLKGVRRYDVPGELATVLRARYDVVIDTEQWYRLSAVIARLVRARRSVGFGGNERSRLFTDPVPYSLADYEPYSFFRLLEPLGIAAPAVLSVPFLSLPEAARAAAARLLAPLWGTVPGTGDDRKRFVAVFPGASVPEKQWGTDRFRETAAALAQAGIPLVVVGGKGEREAGEVIVGEGRGVNLAGKGTLAESAAVIGAAAVLLSGDSGLLHIAAGLGTATVSLFGPSDPQKWAPKGERHRVFSSQLPCAGCAKWGAVPPCRHAGSCLDADPAQVANTVIQLFREAR